MEGIAARIFYGIASQSLRQTIDAVGMKALGTELGRSMG